MTKAFKTFLEETLTNEGYYRADEDVFNLGDGAGWTHRSGITEKAYSEFLGRDATYDDMCTMTFEDITDIYRGMYWNIVKG